MNYLLLVFLLLLSSCGTTGNARELSSITIVDRNGFSETISTPERLEGLTGVNYLTNHPYQSVIRVFKRSQAGDVFAIATSYHENGQPKHYLEILNGRAFGAYMQWHPNGQLALEAHVQEGEPDLTDAAIHSWIFDGVSKAWNAQGDLIAEIHYSKGFLDGDAFYFHPSGAIWKTLCFSEGKQIGEERVYLADSTLLATTQWASGVKDGPAKRFWPNGAVAAEESYTKGLLLQGNYFSPQGERVASIRDGNGQRAIFAKECVSELHSYKEGKLNGEIRILNPNGHLLQVYHLKDGLKHGEDTEFWPSPTQDQKRLALTWVEGQIQGLVTSWYQNGQMESQREIFNNHKQGILTAWYEDGNLMMIEEYDADSLVRGEYYKKGENRPVSRVEKGSGTVTLFEPSGNFKSKATYRSGKPLIR